MASTSYFSTITRALVFPWRRFLKKQPFNALAACSSVIIPVQTEYLAFRGVERMFHTLGTVTGARKHSVDHVILPTLYDQRTRASQETLSLLRRHQGRQAYDAFLGFMLNRSLSETDALRHGRLKSSPKRALFKARGNLPGLYMEM